MRRGILPACAAGAVMLGGCGGQVIDHEDLEAKLRSYLQLEIGTQVKVTCPADKPADKGTTFTCVAASPRGRKVNVRVRLENDNGGFSVVSITEAR